MLKSKYEELIRAYKSVFPFIEACEVSDAANFGLEIPILGETPVFAIKERKVNSFIPLHELSSGMQKVLLLMTDIMCLQPGHIYIVDEYENSLGVNAIDFLPAFLVNNLGGNQFVITTHHPYLINIFRSKIGASSTATAERSKLLMVLLWSKSMENQNNRHSYS